MYLEIDGREIQKELQMRKLRYLITFAITFMLIVAALYLSMTFVVTTLVGLYMRTL